MPARASPCTTSIARPRSDVQLAPGKEKIKSTKRTAAVLYIDNARTVVIEREGEIETNPDVENRPSGSITREEIAQRAYALYEARGREDGHDLDDWVEAERELFEERGR